MFSDTNSGWWAMLLPSEICAQSDPPPLKNTHFAEQEFDHWLSNKL